MHVVDVFNTATRQMKLDHKVAKADFEMVLSLLDNRPIDKISNNELYILAVSNMNLFLISQFNDTKKAEKAIELFELYFEKGENSIETLEAYILTLELTYQYEKSKAVLMKLLNCKQTKMTALKFLSSYTYCAEGLQSIDECIDYKEKLIDLTSDLKEKKRLLKELDSMRHRKTS